jgi:ribosomal protein S18 acetylase RimI-like enzyme
MPNPLVKCTLSIADAHDDAIATLDVVAAHGARYLVSLWVHPDHQGKHHASDLLDEAVQLFGWQPLYVHALPYADRPCDEAALMALYARFGFQPTPGFPGGMWRPATTQE